MPEEVYKSPDTPEEIKGGPVSSEDKQGLSRLKEETGIKNILEDIIYSPSKIRFEIQGENEQIVLFLRRHWVTNIHWIIGTVILILAPIVLGYLPILNFLPLRYQLMGLILWYLFVTAFVFEQFLSWFFNVYIVTNERIIDYDFFNLLYKDIKQADLEKVQDVSAKVGGLARVFFDFGDVLVETAGALPNLEFEAVPDPEGVANLIHDIRSRLVNHGENV